MNFWLIYTKDTHWTCWIGCRW